MTAEEVRALEVGHTVRICSDSGEAVSVECTVAACGRAKFLTYRSKGQLKRFAIRDYPGRSYKLSNYGGHDNEDKRRNQRPQD